MNGHPEEWLIVLDELKCLQRPRKIIGYRLMSACKKDDADSLEAAILEWIEKGYQLYGNPFESKTGYPCQAMVKYENDDNRTD